MTQPLPKHRAREYETVFIVSPESNADAMDTVATRLTDVIGRMDGKVLRAENWGKRKLAYPVNKFDKGTYVYLRYLGYSNVVHELERNMRMIEPVLKYLTVKVAEDVDPSARPVQEEDISFVPIIDDEHDRGERPSTEDSPAPTETAAAAPLETTEASAKETAAAPATEEPSAEAPAAPAPAEPAAEPAPAEATTEAAATEAPAEAKEATEAADAPSGDTDAAPGDTDAEPGDTDAAPGDTDAAPGDTDADQKTEE